MNETNTIPSDGGPLSQLNLPTRMHCDLWEAGHRTVASFYGIVAGSPELAQKLCDDNGIDLRALRGLCRTLLPNDVIAGIDAYDPPPFPGGAILPPETTPEERIGDSITVTFTDKSLCEAACREAMQDPLIARMEPVISGDQTTLTMKGQITLDGAKAYITLLFRLAGPKNEEIELRHKPTTTLADIAKTAEAEATIYVENYVFPNVEVSLVTALRQTLRENAALTLYVAAQALASRIRREVRHNKLTAPTLSRKGLGGAVLVTVPLWHLIEEIKQTTKRTDYEASFLYDWILTAGKDFPDLINGMKLTRVTDTINRNELILRAEITEELVHLGRQ